MLIQLHDPVEENVTFLWNIIHRCLLFCFLKFGLSKKGKLHGQTLYIKHVSLSFKMHIQIKNE